jgi:hypothetical protein
MTQLKYVNYCKPVRFEWKSESREKSDDKYFYENFNF